MSTYSYISSLLLNALRKYAIPDIIIGDKDCKHEFKESLYVRNNDKNDKTAGKKQQTNIGSVGRDEPINHGFCLHCNAWKGQYGLEPTPQMYVEHTRLWAKEAWRVLRNDGIFFLNLADSYPSGGGKAVEQSARRQSAIDTGAYPDYSPLAKLRQSMPKCQLLIPHRVAIGLVEDGWILRNTIIWHKTNAMPESVTDRFSKKYEYIFMFTKREKYYFNLDAVREPHTQAIKDGVDKKEMESVWKAQRESKGKVQLDNSGKTNQGGTVNRNPLYYGNINGKNPGDVFEIPTQPSGLSHYAMWPERLVERMIRCSTKAGDTVLDPFCGSGCTLKVADELQRVGIGIDLGYQKISKKRTANVQKKMFV